ncbi:hypothetical protein NFI00_000115 [Salmonella enterica]|nr:hypothetical protein [Salmonella enterica subsp. enterica serovar Minnesota]EJI5696412.1 hypothetical protein [Salmonella enterica]
MNSANAFSYAISGSMGERQIQSYANFVNLAHQNLAGVGSWLQEQAEKTMNQFNNFVNSRAWELSNRLTKKNEGEYVGRYDIGYLGSLTGLQNAQGFMRNYIMANPNVMQLYLDDEISGYNGELHSRCTGLAEENIYYRKAMNGVLDFRETENGQQLHHAHYFEQGNALSFRERVDIQRTWAAANHHLAATEFDITSSDGAKRKSFITDEDQPSE